MTQIQKKRCEVLIAELNSGKYRQITGRLAGDGNCYCIMGVMCKIYRDKTGRGHFIYNNFLPKNVNKDGDYTFVFNSVIKNYYGLPTEFSGIKWYRLNDRYGYTFKDFAQIIRQLMDNENK